MNFGRVKFFSIFAAAGLLVGTPSVCRAGPIKTIVIADESYEEVAGCQPGCDRGDDVLYAPGGAEIGRRLDSGRLYFKIDKGIEIASFGPFRDGLDFINSVNECLREKRKAQAAVEKLPDSGGKGRLVAVTCDPHRVITAKGLHAVKARLHFCSDMSDDCYDFERESIRDEHGQEASFLHSMRGLDFGPLMSCVEAGRTADVTVDFDSRTVDLICR